MNYIKLVGLSSILAAGIANAAPTAPACDGFQIKVKNTLPDSLVVKTVKLQGAEIQPGAWEKIAPGQEAIFTVNRSLAGAEMAGEVALTSINSIPPKTLHIRFNLKNTALTCNHTDTTSKDDDYSVSTTRLPGTVNYSIANK